MLKFIQRFRPIVLSLVIGVISTIVVNCLLYTSIYAATCTSQVSGNWNSTTTWDCGIVPDADDDVVIGAGHTVTMIGAASVNSVSILSGGIFDGNDGGGTESYLGVHSSWVNNGSATDHWIALLGTNPGLSGTFNRFERLEVHDGLTLSQAIIIDEYLGLIGGALNNGTDTTTLSNRAEIKRTNGIIINPPIFDGAVNITYGPSANTLTTGAELPTNATVLSKLSVQNPDGIMLNAPVQVNSLLELREGWVNSTHPLTIGDQAVIARSRGHLGIIPNFLGKVNLEYFDVLTNDIVQNITAGNELPAGPTTLNNFSIRNSGAVTQVMVTLNTNPIVNGNLSIAISTTLIAHVNGVIEIKGNWDNQGSFIHNHGTVNFTGNNQILYGATTFYNLTKIATTINRISFEFDKTQTILGALTLQGKSATERLFLRGTLPTREILATQWKIDPQGVRTVNFVDVRDSHNINFTAIGSSSGSNGNSGNNTNWILPLSSSPGTTVNTQADQPTQLAFLLDGSGSVAPIDFNTTINGIATAIQNSTCVPHDGSLELTVIQFASNAQTELPPTIISAGNAASIANNIRNIIQQSSSTNYTVGFNLAVQELKASPNFSVTRQVINIATDGQPNDTSHIATIQAAISAGIDEINAEGIGLTSSRSMQTIVEDEQPIARAETDPILILKNEVVYPQPGTLHPPAPWPATSPGWVRLVNNAQEFSDTICEMFQTTISAPTTNVDGPSIHIEKSPNNQWVEAGESAPFSITVQNNGTVSLENFTVVDPKTPDCNFNYTGVLLPTQVINYQCKQIAARESFVNEATVTASYAITNISRIVSASDTGSVIVTTGTREALGDFVWEDLNANGIQDVGEPGLAGVAVHLLDSHGNITGTTTSDEQGLYRFINILPSTYVLHFLQPKDATLSPQNQGNSDTKDSDASLLGGKTDPISLKAGLFDRSLDAGFYYSGTISGQVWRDRDNDGFQDIDESGFPAININLSNSSGAVITTTTNGQGIYTFTNLIPDMYIVQFITPNEYSLSPQDQGFDDAVDSDANRTDGKTAALTILSRTGLDTIDAGMYSLTLEEQSRTTVGDRVWDDKNQNGLQDNGEPGLSSVAVDLLDSNDKIVRTTATDTNGRYQFVNVISGTYSLRFLTPISYTFSLHDQGSNDAQDSDANPVNGKSTLFQIKTDEINNTIDAGMYLQKTIISTTLSGFVWEDKNENGIQEANEVGLQGVTVELFDPNEIVKTLTTGPDGTYQFIDIPAGVYKIHVVKPTGFDFTILNQGNDDTKDSDINRQTGKSPTITLTPGMNVGAVDAGLRRLVEDNRLAELGDFVWEDRNGNGIQDTGEFGVSNVLVTLIQSDGSTITQTTNLNGEYLFANLLPGTYAAGFELPTGYAFNLNDQGTDDTKDSDVSTSTGQTAPIVLRSGESNRTADVGMYRPAQISGFVWEDINFNDLQDIDEAGFANVKIDLLDTSDVLLKTTTTDKNGRYRFNDLIPGTYILQFISPQGYTLSNADQGISDELDSDANLPSGRTAEILLASGEETNSVDAGLTLDVGGQSFIGGLVWYDQNRDGIRNAGSEPSVPNLMVKLWDSEHKLVETAISSENGSYQFELYGSGIYYLQFVLPDGYEFSLQDRGDNNLDSDVDTETARTPLFDLTNLTDASWDVGIMQVLPIIAPQIDDTNIKIGYTDSVNEFLIYGTDFFAGSQQLPLPSIRLRHSEGQTFDIAQVTLINENRLHIEVPPNLPVGVYDLIVINPNGERDILLNALVLAAPGTVVPVVHEIVPLQQRSHESGELQIIGEGFGDGAAVQMGGVSLQVLENSGTQLQVQVPADKLMPDVYDLIITNLDGTQGQFPQSFTILQAEPMLSSVQPDYISVIGRTEVELYGDNLQTGIAAYLENANEGITFTIPITWINTGHLTLQIAGSELIEGTYDIVLINPDGRENRIEEVVTILATAPIVLDVRPNRGKINLHTELNIYGQNFNADSIVEIGDKQLATTYLNETHLQIVIPANTFLSTQIHDLVVVNNATGESDKLAGSYIALDANADDLLSYNYEVWVDPPTPRANTTSKIGLTLYRDGGTGALMDTTVHLWIEQPDGQLLELEDVIVDKILPSDSSLIEVDWRSSTDGFYTLFAEIDPENSIVEAIESNNVVSRTILVLPQVADQIAPSIDSLTINGDPDLLLNRNILLQFTATDPVVDTNESIPSEQANEGVSAIFIQESAYNVSVGQWIPIQESEWIKYSTIPLTGLPWQLVDSPGVKTIQIWASDNAGNISLFPAEIQLNYRPEINRVGLNQGHVFRYQLDEGQCVRSQIIPENSGDPDLYIWPPDNNAGRPPWVSNQESGEESIHFNAPIAGLYQVEVYGFTEAEYRLLVDEVNDDCPSFRMVNYMTGKEFPTPPTTDVPSMRRQLSPPPASPAIAPSIPDEPLPVQMYLPLIKR